MQQRDNRRLKVWTRRAALVAGGQGLLLALLGGRLYQLQIVQQDKYATLADEQRINLRLLAPPRGRVVDRFGVPLATNRQNYRVSLIADQVANVDATLDAVAVLIPDSAAEFASVSGDSLDSHDIAAVAVADSVSPDGTVLGARIVLNPTTLPRLDAAGRRLVVQHELTHIASRADTDDQMPTWVIEGFADYVGNLDSGQPVRTAAAELSGEIRHGMVPAALPTGADFDGANTRLAQVYEESWLACRLIAARAGQQGLVRFYRDVSTAALSQPATAAAVGLQQVLHTGVASFTAQWRAYLQAELA